MNPSATAAALYDALDAEDVARVDTRHAFICGYQEGVTGPAQAYRVQAYEQGYRAGIESALSQQPAPPRRLCGRRIHFEGQSPLTCHLPVDHPGDCAYDQAVTTDLELIANGGTIEQQARADALAAAGHVLAAAVRSGGLVVIQEGDGILGLGAALVKLAREPATWIEHGDPAPATLAEHVETAMGLVGAARAVVADALGTIKDNPDLGHRVDQALDAAKMAQPRARPTQT